MNKHLVLTVYLHDRFHGMARGGPEWPPSPARLFQALVAGVARGNKLPKDTEDALVWLESQPPPVIGAPRSRLGGRVVMYVPNNDADSLSDPTEVSSIRTKKHVQPRILENDAIVYAWSVRADAEGHSSQIADTAAHLYQLGRGVDMAWAVGELVETQAFHEKLAAYDGEILEPNDSPDFLLACPTPGSLSSLLSRHAWKRISVEGSGQRQSIYFSNSPKPYFAGVGYRPQTTRLLFDLRRPDAPERPAPARLTEVVELVERVRDAVATRLTRELPAEIATIEQEIVGRHDHAAGSNPSTRRITIVPLPSIGHEHADRSVRRVLVEIPSGLRLRHGDIAWAFAGLDVIDPQSGEVLMVLAASEDTSMLRRHYEPAARRFRSVTAVALPEAAGRRRIHPKRQRDEAKGGAERAREDATARRAVAEALRHAGVRARVVDVRVQREPFEAKNQRAERFERKPRFNKERLWHIEVEFDRSVAGPLVLGDGRYLGLGVTAPVRRDAPAIQFFAIESGLESDVSGLPRALRRAVMARAQATVGPGVELRTFFTGHSDEGTPAQRETHPHLAFVHDRVSNHLLVLAPHILERRAPTSAELRHLGTLDRALEEFDQLRAGRAGVLGLKRVTAPDLREHPVLGSSDTWESMTPYVVTRHAHKKTPAEAVIEDVLAECRRIDLPLPSVEASKLQGISGVGLTASIRLIFPRTVSGPLLLGRTRHLGGGLLMTSTCGIPS
jgi:CRISPR-associated protein Csb2